MRHIGIYSLSLLLLMTACNRAEHVPGSLSVISELIAETEQMGLSRALTGKKTFESGDQIHLFGFVKPASSGTRGTRFMPAVITSGIGLTYTYMNSTSLRGYRFGRTVTGLDEVGLWQVGQYHDFAAYYFAGGKFSAETKVFSIDDETGLLPEELLWGETKNWLYRGDATIRPEIKFKHKLSRIRVELVHDMNEVAAGNFTITKLEFELNKDKREFDVVEGTWADIGGAGIATLEQDVDKALEDIPIAKVMTITDSDWWVPPGCTINNFVLHFINGKDGNGDDNHTSTPVGIFTHNDTNTPLAPVVTREGYITVLRLHINDVKPIIFTVELQEWSDNDRYEIVIDEGNKVEDD